MSVNEHRAALRLGEGVPGPVLCFSHLRWNFVYQRPQHLLSRCAKERPVFFVEEPVFEELREARLKKSVGEDGVVVVTPVVPRGLSDEELVATQKEFVDELIASEDMSKFVAWYYTPMAMPFTRHLAPEVTVYDCMDELAAFRGAPPEMVAYEVELFSAADVVFTGGRSLYLSKRAQHHNVHLFASSVDVEHFSKARAGLADAADQERIARPRVGFFGVLDERLDRELLANAAALLPEWQFVLIGPVVKIREDELPQAENIHYLGQKSYAELPAYIANWDVAMLPFAMSESTRFISPTKTPEYLAAGKTVVSTPVPDVVFGYGQRGLVQVGKDAAEFAAAIEAAAAGYTQRWRSAVDEVLRGESWDKVWQGMWQCIERAGELTARIGNSVPASQAERTHV